MGQKEYLVADRKGSRKAKAWFQDGIPVEVEGEELPVIFMNLAGRVTNAAKGRVKKYKKYFEEENGGIVLNVKTNRDGRAPTPSGYRTLSDKEEIISYIYEISSAGDIVITRIDHWGENGYKRGKIYEVIRMPDGNVDRIKLTHKGLGYYSPRDTAIAEETLMVRRKRTRMPIESFKGRLYTKDVDSREGYFVWTGFKVGKNGRVAIGSRGIELKAYEGQAAEAHVIVAGEQVFIYWFIHGRDLGKLSKAVRVVYDRYGFAEDPAKEKFIDDISLQKAKRIMNPKGRGEMKQIWFTVWVLSLWSHNTNDLSFDRMCRVYELLREETADVNTNVKDEIKVLLEMSLDPCDHNLGDMPKYSLMTHLRNIALNVERLRRFRKRADELKKRSRKMRYNNNELLRTCSSDNNDRMLLYWVIYETYRNNPELLGEELRAYPLYWGEELSFRFDFAQRDQEAVFSLTEGNFYPQDVRGSFKDGKKTFLAAARLVSAPELYSRFKELHEFFSALNSSLLLNRSPRITLSQAMQTLSDESFERLLNDWRAIPSYRQKKDNRADKYFSKEKEMLARLRSGESYEDIAKVLGKEEAQGIIRTLYRYPAFMAHIRELKQPFSFSASDRGGMKQILKHAIIPRHLLRRIREDFPGLAAKMHRHYPGASFAPITAKNLDRYQEYIRRLAAGKSVHNGINNSRIEQKIQNVLCTHPMIINMALDHIRKSRNLCLFEEVPYLLRLWAIRFALDEAVVYEIRKLLFSLNVEVLDRILDENDRQKDITLIVAVKDIEKQMGKLQEEVEGAGLSMKDESVIEVIHAYISAMTERIRPGMNNEDFADTIIACLRLPENSPAIEPIRSAILAGDQYALRIALRQSYDYLKEQLHLLKTSIASCFGAESQLLSIEDTDHFFDQMHRTLAAKGKSLSAILTNGDGNGTGATKELGMTIIPRVKIIIVGAGIGGSYAARLAAQKGFEVEVMEKTQLERARLPLFGRKCAEGVWLKKMHKAGFDLDLNSLPNWVDHAVEGVVLGRMFIDGDIDMHTFDSAPYLLLDRQSFINENLQAAQEEGARIHYGRQIRDLTSFVEENQNSIIVLASGTNMNITRQLLMSSQQDKYSYEQNYVNAAQYTFSGVDLSFLGGFKTAIFSDDPRVRYFYSFPKGHSKRSVTNVGIMMDGYCARSAFDLLDSFIRALNSKLGGIFDGSEIIEGRTFAKAIHQAGLFCFLFLIEKNFLMLYLLVMRQSRQARSAEAV